MLADTPCPWIRFRPDVTGGLLEHELGIVRHGAVVPVDHGSGLVTAQLGDDVTVHTGDDLPGDKRAAEGVVVEALAVQEPFWKPGSAHGYHARTYGFLVDELVRRIAGINVGAYFRGVFAAPLELDLWIGLPPELADDVAPIYSAQRTRPPSDEDPFYTELAKQDSLTFKAFTTPAGLMVPSIMNRPEIRTQVLPSFGGIGTAESLAAFYYHTFCEPTFFSPERIAAISETAASGIDAVLRIPTAFAA